MPCGIGSSSRIFCRSFFLVLLAVFPNIPTLFVIGYGLDQNMQFFCRTSERGLLQFLPQLRLLDAVDVPFHDKNVLDSAALGLVGRQSIDIAYPKERMVQY